jgi:hypothetical protein
MKPSMIPNAVHTCHCITSAPRILAGAHSAAYTGTVADCRAPSASRGERGVSACTHLRPDAEAEHEAGGEQMRPAVRDALPDAGEEGEEGGDEDRPAAAEVVVERAGEPAAEDGAAEVGRGVDEADEDAVVLGLAADAELLRVEELGAVDDGLVHALHGRGDGAEGDEVVEHSRLAPFWMRVSGNSDHGMGQPTVCTFLLNGSELVRSEVVFFVP